MPNALVLDGLTKVFPNGAVALDGVSLEVEAGTFLVLLGPSGSGKTTLVRLLAGIERATSGSIHLGGIEVAGPGRHLPPERRDLSMVFQDYALWPHLSAVENVAFALRRRESSRALRRSRAAEMLERVGLAYLAGRYPSELSGGEQQRVALARALVADTGLVLYDEPLSNLDADLRDRMRLEISALTRQAGTSAVYITHDQSEAFALADRVGVLDRGRLIQSGLPEEIYSLPASPFVARFTGVSGELAVRLRSGPGPDSTCLVEAVAGPDPVAFRAMCLRPSGGDLPCGGGHLPCGGTSGPAAAGKVLFRPAAVRLTAGDGIGAHVRGVVADVAFRGRGYEVAVDLPGGARLSAVYSPSRPARGEAVGLSFDPAGSFLFPADGPVAT